MSPKAKSTTAAKRKKKPKLTAMAVKDLSGRKAAGVKGGLQQYGQGGYGCGCLDTKCNNYSRTQYSL
jgi:hypothetical protein